MKIVALLLALASVCLADNFKTNNGREYKDATISRVEADGIVVITGSGIAKLYFAELPSEVQERFHYDPEKAAAFAAQQSRAYAEQKAAAEAIQAEEQSKQQQRHSLAAQQQAQVAASQAKQNTIDGLTLRLQNLKQQEDNLIEKIAEAQHAEKAASQIKKRNKNYIDPAELELPKLRSHLGDIREDKKSVKRELERAKR